MSLPIEPADDPTLGLGGGVAPGIPQPEAWTGDYVGGGFDDNYDELIQAVRRFLDHVAAAKPEVSTIRALTADLNQWSDRLEGDAVSERDQYFSRRFELPDRGQSLVPAFRPAEVSRDHVVGATRFGRYHLGGNGAAHGGVIPLLFDEVLGWLAGTGGRSPCRTAYLKVDYRAITPIGRDLRVEARFVKEEGRKRLLSGVLMNGAHVCAEAEGLFVELMPGQP